MAKRVLPAHTRQRRTQTKHREKTIERAERAYVGLYRQLEGEAAAIVEQFILMHALPVPLGQDAFGKDWTIILLRLKKLFADPRNWRELFGRIASQLDSDVLGVLVRTVPRIDRARLLPLGQTQEFAQRNAELITNVSTMLQKQVAAFFEGAPQGAHVAELTERLRSQFNIGEARARLWARDQTLKLHGELTQARHAQVGITRYIWTASGDERVRVIHGELDGTEQKYSDPPIISEDGRRGHPGDDYQCRCTSYPILD